MLYTIKLTNFQFCFNRFTIDQTLKSTEINVEIVIFIILTLVAMMMMMLMMMTSFTAGYCAFLTALHTVVQLCLTNLTRRTFPAGESV